MSKFMPLTPRQQEILQLIWHGLTCKEIAARLGLSFRTVEVHRALLMKRLKVNNAAHLFKRALRERLIRL